MSKAVIIILVILGLLVSVVAVSAMVGVGYFNDAVALENTFKAQVKANESTYDKMWKVISKKAQVTENYSSEFRKNFSSIMEGRYGKAENRQQAMFNWIKEQNPAFDSKMFATLSNSIEGLHNEFDMAQKKMISIKAQHENLRLKFPSNLIVGSRAELELAMVTSSRTDKAFSEGKDDNVDVFGKGKE